MKRIKIVPTVLALSLSLSASATDLIVKLKDRSEIVDNKYVDELGRTLTIKRTLIESMNLYLAELATQDRVMRNLSDEVESIRENDNVEYVAIDEKMTQRVLPNDISVATQWSFDSKNLGFLNPMPAWDITTGGKDYFGNDIVVAVVDGGVDLKHQDLLANLWTNSNEIAGNNIDDDNNGYKDDINGWNAYSNNAVIPANKHGTHVAGIVGAVGNNNLGVTGINWNVKIMPIAASSGTTSVVLAGYGYALAQKKLWLETNGQKGANVVVTNSSFGVDYGNCQSAEYSVWNDIYNEMGKYGILSIAATANASIDVDVVGDVPTGCKSQYLIKVTNVTKEGVKYSRAGYGKNSINIAAPGTDIFSTLPNNQYGSLTGTSMATPQIAGAVALTYAAASANLSSFIKETPDQGALLIKELILSNAKPVSSFTGLTTTGGILDLGKTVQRANNY